MKERVKEWKRRRRTCGLSRLSLCLDYRISCVRIFIFYSIRKLFSFCLWFLRFIFLSILSHSFNDSWVMNLWIQSVSNCLASAISSRFASLSLSLSDDDIWFWIFSDCVYICSYECSRCYLCVHILPYLTLPTYGMYTDRQIVGFKNANGKNGMERKRGWTLYYIVRRTYIRFDTEQFRSQIELKKHFLKRKSLTLRSSTLIFLLLFLLDWIWRFEFDERECFFYLSLLILLWGV